MTTACRRVRYLQFRVVVFLYSLAVCIYRIGLHRHWHAKEYLPASCAFLSYLTNQIITLTLVYSALSLAPCVFPALATVRWDGLFHPLGPVRRCLFIISATSTLYLSLVFWTMLWGRTPTYELPHHLQGLSLIDNIGVHGSHFLWLLMDAAYYDPALLSPFTKANVAAPFIFGLVYLFTALIDGITTHRYPYYFLEPEFPMRLLVIVSVLCMCVGTTYQ
ncbi:hypothetical protein KIPB_013697 [Kipferlia bialata]|uniref:Uncharacterized protein n=1 Tax=Kipferlia bialata TaxID=797122 RepID=A0A9K3DAR9_9EUKA|nr:hypothetical protein KIPB_013697 [Kipferlia bialata]|eukprot:g13697.t1